MRRIKSSLKSTKGKKRFTLKTEIYASSFKKKILLCMKSYGTTLKDLAIRARLEAKYARAVGTVMRSNPIPIV